MTEKDYVKAQDLATLLCVKDCFNRLLPETSNIIKTNEYSQVSEILAKWLQEHFDSMKVTDIINNKEKKKMLDTLELYNLDNSELEKILGNA